MLWEAIVYHAKDGFFFLRGDNGQVSITIVEHGSVAKETVLDADTWASVVATVSASGDTSLAHSVALEYHNTDLNRDPASVQGVAV